MNVSSIGVVAVTPTTGVSQKPAVEPVEPKEPVLQTQTNEQNKEQPSKGPQPTSEPSPPPAPAPNRLTGLLVDRLA